MSVVGGHYQSRFGAGSELWPRPPQKIKIDRKTAMLLIAFCALLAALFILLKIAFLFFDPPPLSAPASQADPAATPPAAAAPAPDRVDKAWTTLEPAYRTYKVTIGDDSSLKLNGRPAQLYGFHVIPRTKICTYANGERWACGQRAYIALLNLMGSTTIDCLEKNKGVPIDIDTPRSFECRLPGTDLAELLLAEGWGTPEPGVNEPRYHNAANRARLMNAGMWQAQSPGSS